MVEWKNLENRYLQVRGGWYILYIDDTNLPFPVGADLCRYKEPTRGCESNNRVNHVSSNRRKRVDALFTGTLGDTCVRGGVDSR